MIVVWRVTQHCNLSCPFCSYDRTLSLPRVQASLETVMRFAAVLSAYQKTNDDPVLVSWIGGEPFLWRHLREATLRLTDEFGLRVSATSNGTTLGSADVKRLIVERFSELTISVDAPGAAHDALRGWPGGFDRLERHVSEVAREKAIAGRGPLLRINTVLMRDNLPRFEELCLRVAAWGVNEITFNQLGGRDRPEFFPDHRLRASDVDHLEDFVPALRARLAERGVRLNGGAGYVRRMRASASGDALPMRHCGVGRRFLFVDERGLTAPCNYTVEQIGVPLNELGSVEAFSALPIQLEAARERCRPAACEDCHSTQVWDKFAGAK
jgi:MoaA/NifB/PqqE/SkfB family radical SAM enzyme